MNDHEKLLLEEILDNQKQNGHDMRKLFEKMEDVDKRVVSMETKVKLFLPVLTMFFVSVGEFVKNKIMKL